MLERLAPPTLPAQIERGVADHAQHPGLEGAAALEIRQIDQGLDERLLHRIERIGLIAEQPIGYPKGNLAITAKQLLEGLSIAPRRTLQ